MLVREKRECLRHWQLRKMFWRDKGRRGMLNMTWKKFKVWNFRRKSRTSAECPELPKKVRNFRRISGTSEEMSGTSEDSRKFQQILRFEQILILENLEIDLG